jgi:hypothetical protein
MKRMISDERMMKKLMEDEKERKGNKKNDEK